MPSRCNARGIGGAEQMAVGRDQPQRLPFVAAREQAQRDLLPLVDLPFHPQRSWVTRALHAVDEQRRAGVPEMHPLHRDERAARRRSPRVLVSPKKPGNSATVAISSTTMPLISARRCFLKRHQTSFQFGATEIASASLGDIEGGGGHRLRRPSGCGDRARRAGCRRAACRAPRSRNRSGRSCRRGTCPG